MLEIPACSSFDKLRFLNNLSCIVQRERERERQKLSNERKDVLKECQNDTAKEKFQDEITDSDDQTKIERERHRKIDTYGSVESITTLRLIQARLLWMLTTTDVLSMRNEDYLTGIGVDRRWLLTME